MTHSAAGIARTPWITAGHYQGEATQEPASVQWRTLPIVPLLMGLFLVAVSMKLSAGGDYSLARTAVLLLICGLITVYGALWDPYAPFYCYAFVGPTFPVFGSGIALAVAGTILVLMNQRKAQWQWNFSWIGASFCLWALVSLFWAERLYFGQDSFIVQAIPPMVVAIVLSGIKNPLFRRNLILVVVAGCAIGSLFCLRHFILGSGDFGAGRTYGLISSDVFSAWELFGFLGALAWLLAGHPPRWLRNLLILSLLLIIAGIGLSGERAAIVAAGLGIVIVGLCTKRLYQGVVLLIVVGIGAVLVYLVYPAMFDPVLSRFKTIGVDGGSDRLEIWGSALKVFAESPLIGVGTENFRFAVGRYYGKEFLAHSIYVGTLVELGIVGILLMACWFGILLRKTWRAGDRLWVFPLLVVYLVEGLFLHEFLFICFWLVLGLAEGALSGNSGARIMLEGSTHARHPRPSTSYQPKRPVRGALGNCRTKKTLPPRNLKRRWT